MTTTVTTPLRALALGVALGDLGRGVRETSPNWGPRIEEALRNAGIHVPAPWCAAWIQLCSDEAAQLHDLRNPLDDVVRQALVLDYYTWAKERDYLIPADQVDRGDLVLFDFPNNGRTWDHIGFVVDPPEGGRVRTIEGNTDSAGGREGIEVAIRDRVISDRVAFARWDEGIVYTRG